MFRTIVITLIFLTLFITKNIYAMDGDEIKALIEDKTVDMFNKKKQEEYRRFFAKGGILMEIHPEKGFSKGNWSIDEEKLCFAFDDGSAKCRPVMEVDGDYGTDNRKGTKMRVKFTGYEDSNTLDIPKDELVQALNIKHAKEELITLSTRTGVKQTFLLIEPPSKPKGVVVLYPGHEGVIRFKKIGNRFSGENEGGGLTAHEKSRHEYSKQGFVVAILAPPSDQEYGMNTTFRSSEEHARDAEKVIEYLIQKYDHKVYLHGHCRSTFSPASVATRLNNKGIAGLILSSVRSEGKHGGVVDYEKGKVKVPVLLVQHVDDTCKGTLYKNMPKVKSFYQNSTMVDVITVKGGDNTRSSARDCGGGYHSFKALQKPVMDNIINWINKEKYSAHIE